MLVKSQRLHCGLNFQSRFHLFLKLRGFAQCMIDDGKPAERSFYLFIYLFIYLPAPGLGCSMLDIELRHANFQLQACQIQFPDQGWNLGPLHQEHRVLATGPPGKYRKKSWKDNCVLKTFSHAMTSGTVTLMATFHSHVVLSTLWKYFLHFKK